MYRRTTTIVTAAVVCLAIAGGAATEPPYPIAWTRQLGTASEDWSNGVAADGLGNVYVSGYTRGSLGGPNAGVLDAFLSKYDAAGSFVWTRQLGTPANDINHGVATDGLGNVYLSGYTLGSLGGPNNANTYDAFVSKYDAAGSLLWSRQLGTSSRDDCYGVATDGLGNVYLSGSTWGSLDGANAGIADAFVSKYDSAGSLAWTRQLGTSDDDRSFGVAADVFGNVYLSGTTWGSLSGPNAGDVDSFVSKYDAAGSFVWSRQLGTSANDFSHGVATDGLGNVYVSGMTDGNLGGTNAGGADVFVNKYDVAGSLVWSSQFGTPDAEVNHSVATDSLGNVYVSGYTLGSLGGPNAGVQDAYVSKCDASGSVLWTRQFGTIGWDTANCVATDHLGNVFISGFTWGDLGGPNAGSRDAFVVKLVPEPSTLALLGVAGATLLLLMLRRRRSGNSGSGLTVCC